MTIDAERAKSIYTRAVEDYQPEQWEDFLSQACGDNSALRDRVEQMLKAHLGTASSLAHDAAGDASEATVAHAMTEGTGSHIGPYKLLQQIGEGGMGVVYMAEQKHPVKRRVALKIIKPGMDTRQVIARFEAERQALAMMDHPNIARVLDAGQTQSGRPYFVMELVHGTPITEYSDEQRLTPAERLQLFLPICHAVQHAHQKGIIHRDLKPSNILVALYDGQAVPKVIDFGVAKATNQNLTDKTLFTQFGQVVGTLEYMSPEQAERNQLDIDTRSDIYSLGVVLYELLTGEPPFDRGRLRSAAFHEMLRILREEDPPRPSTKLGSSQSLPSIAANRRIEPAKLTGTLRGDLDWIVMKSLEKDRVRRYDTASAFAEDISRFLADEAISARPPSRRYRMQKFAARNKGLITSVAAVMLALFVGFLGISFQLLQVQRARKVALEERYLAESERKRAEEAGKIANDNLAKARNAVSDIVNVAAQLTNVPEADPIRIAMVDSALSYYEDFLKMNQDNPEMKSDVASTHMFVGQLRRERGDFLGAIAEFEKAESLLKDISGDETQRISMTRTLADAYFSQAVSWREVGELDESSECYEKAIELRSNLIDEFADDDDRLKLSHYYHNFAITYYDAGELEQAEEYGNTALRLANVLLQKDPTSYAYRTRVARVSGYLGAVKFLQGNWTEASPYMRVTAEMHEQLARDNPNDRDCQRRVAVSADWLAKLALRNQDFDEALDQSERAIEIGEELVDSFPMRFRYRSELADHYMTLASIHEAQGNREGVHENFKKSVAASRFLANQNASYMDLMRALSAYGDSCVSNREFDQAVEILRDQLNLTVEAELDVELRGRARLALGDTLVLRGLDRLETDRDVAERDLEQGIAYLENALSEFMTVESSAQGVANQWAIETLTSLVRANTAWDRAEEVTKWQAKLDALNPAESAPDN